MSSLVFLHLSDIHFQRNAGSTYDPQAGLRNELELDIKDFTAATFKHVNGILITGDVAYSGHPDEYAYARTWIEKIAGILKLIPGEDGRAAAFQRTPEQHYCALAAMEEDRSHNTAERAGRHYQSEDSGQRG